MRYVIKPLAIRKIRSFYRNVYKKYPNTYAYADMLRYINATVDAIYSIEVTALRRKPTVEHWQGWNMAHVGNWYYAYTIDDNTIVIHDASHTQNMK